MVTVILGLFIGIGIFAYSLTGAAANTRLYLDGYSLILVVGGTLSAGLMSITWKNLKGMLETLAKTFGSKEGDVSAVTDELVLISEKAHRAHAMTELPHDSEDEFIQKGIRLLQNEMGPVEVRKIMAEALLNERNRINQDTDIIKSMAKYPPSFGMVGTILGLIGLLEDMSLQSGFDKIGLNMAMALVTTLYGLLLSNYVMLPLAEVVLNKAQSDFKVKRTILEVMVLIAANKNDPVLVKEYLGVLGQARVHRDEEVAA